MEYEITKISKPGGAANAYTSIEKVFIQRKTQARKSPLMDILPSSALINPLVRFENAPKTGIWRNVADVITDLKQGNSFYYTDTKSAKAYVEVATRNGKEYIKTKADYTQRDNLLSLPNEIN